jgi:excinuclease UvrABC helicase subunit UvrB
MDPEIDVRSAKNQVDDLYGEIRSASSKIGSGFW